MILLRSLSLETDAAVCKTTASSGGAVRTHRAQPDRWWGGESPMRQLSTAVSVNSYVNIYIINNNHYPDGKDKIHGQQSQSPYSLAEWSLDP